MIIPHALRLISGITFLGFVSFFAQAESLSLPPTGSDLVGRIRYVKAQQGDTLIDVAHRNSVGQDEIVQANPTPSRYYWVPGEGTKVRIPDQYILPDAPRTGIVVNIPEMRLYFYPPGGTEVVTYPISIGRMDWKSPMGVTKIVEKIKDPTWTPPESIKREHALDGEILPDVVPAGPDNPLGRFAMRLGVKGSYLIHGTGQNKADGIGMMVTHGCMRMYPEDVEQLYPKVSVGTQVNLINQPVKVGWLGDTLYVEVSQPLDEDNLSYSQLASLASGLIQKKTAERPGTVINKDALKEALEKSTGIPTAITGNSPVTTRTAAPEPQSPSTTGNAGLPTPTTASPVPGQPIRQPSQVVIPPSHPPRTATSMPSTTPSNPAYTAPRPVARPIAPSTPDVPPGPPVSRSNTKPEQQLLPPIY